MPSLPLQESKFYGPLGFCQLLPRVGAPPTPYSKPEGLVSSQTSWASIVCLVESGTQLDWILHCSWCPLYVSPPRLECFLASSVTTSHPHQPEGLPPLGCPRTNFLWISLGQMLPLITHLLGSPFMGTEILLHSYLCITKCLAQHFVYSCWPRTITFIEI